MAHTSQIIKQIIEVRGRRMSNLPTGELFTRLMFLEKAYKKRKDHDEELLKYYPIALVACIEGFFRLAIQEIVDTKECFLESAGKLASRLKFDFGIVRELHGKKITIGELVSHVIPLNSLQDISSQISELLSVDFLKELRVVQSRWDVEVNRKPPEPILKYPDEVYGGVAKTFELRHIFCHEFASEYGFDLADIERCFDATQLFLKSSDEYLSEILYPNAPLTQSAMNEAAALDYQREVTKLDELNQQLLKSLSPKRQEEYKALHKTWETFLKLSINFEGQKFGRGTIRPLMEWSTAAWITKRRQEEVTELINSVAK